MKAFYAVLLVVFLASCGANDVSMSQDSTQSVAVEETSQEIDEALGDLPEDIQEESVSESEELAPEQEEIVSDDSQNSQQVDDSNQEIESDETASEKVVELSTTYNNPAMQVVMNIEYTLGSDNTISEISVTSPNYKGMPEFNAGVQAVVGMSVSDASDYYVSGSSLTTPAFQKALKSSI